MLICLILSKLIFRVFQNSPHKEDKIEMILNLDFDQEVSKILKSYG